jgi:3-isopropylmalate/(R)-2-methylmalate dehydratase small subunit
VIVDPASHRWLVEHPGADVVIDLASATIELGGRRVPFPIDGFARYCLMNGVDQLGFLLEQEAAIRRYEQGHA